jgi:group I intron endonuclease
MKYFIYVIKNVQNEKTYVGKTNDPDRRWRAHKWSAKNGQKSKLYDAMRKHGPENFEMFLLESDSDENSLNRQKSQRKKLEKIIRELIVQDLKKLVNFKKAGLSQKSTEKSSAKQQK